MSDDPLSISGDDAALLREGARRAVDFDAQLDGSVTDCIRVLPPDSNERVRVLLRDIATLTFTGKDAASGKSWENWLRRYAARKLAGLDASIESETE